MVVEPHQLPLLRQQHACGGQLQAGQDLLPEAVEIEIGSGWGRSWSGLLDSGRCRLSRHRRDGGAGGSRSRCWLSRDGRWRHRGHLGFSQQTQQQHFQPKPRLSALAQLRFAAAQALLPAQQARTSELLGQRWQSLAIGRREASELQMLWSGQGQNQIPQQSCQPLQHSSRFAAAIQQLAAALQQFQRVGGLQGSSELQQLLLRHGTQQFPHRVWFHRRRQQAELIQQALGVP